MKIYNKIVCSISTGEILEEDSFEYEGEVALCGSGGSETTVTTMIPEETETEKKLKELQLSYIEKSLPIQEQLLEMQKMSQEFQNKYLPQYLENQASLLPLQKAEAQFYLETVPQQLELSKQQMASQAELQPLQTELYKTQLQLAQKALSGESLATDAQKATLRERADQYKAEATSGLTDVGNTLFDQAVQKGLARGIPYSDIARGFESEVGKYIASETSSINREAERMYTAGLTDYPTAMAQFAQQIAGGTSPQVSSGGYTTPAMNQIGGTAQLQSSGSGIDSLNQMLSQLKSERYGQATQTTTFPETTWGEAINKSWSTGLLTAPYYKYVRGSQPPPMPSPAFFV